MTFRRGARLGIDVGTVRIGVARCDPDGILATPVATITRGDGDIDEILAYAAEYDVMEIIVGLPLALSGEQGIAAGHVQAFTAALVGRGYPIRLVDERLTTASAQRSLHAIGKDTRTSRSFIDQAAAVEIVQSAVDHEKNTGTPPGKVVSDT